MTLKEMKNYINTTVLQDETEIQKAIDNFINLRASSLLSTLSEHTTNEYNMLIHDLFLANSTYRGLRPPLDNTMADDLSIIELFSLLYDTLVKSSGETRNGYHKYECYHLAWFQWFNRIMLSNDYNPVIYRFLSIQLDAYIHLLKSSFPTAEEANQFMTMYDHIIERAQIELDESATITDFLCCAWNQSHNSWIIDTNLIQFRDTVIAAQRLNEWLFCHSLAHLRKHEFDIQRIEHKYRITLEEKEEL